MRTSRSHNRVNPYYEKDLKRIKQQEEERKDMFNKNLNEKQINLFEEEEKLANEFSRRILNNFEGLLTLFDNFIFDVVLFIIFGVRHGEQAMCS